MRRITATFLLVLALAGCATRRLTLPSGTGTPFPGYAAAYAEAVAGCRGANTITATLSLSGRAGETRLRSVDVDAGFAAPSDVRLEGRAPFGRPVFIFVARDERTATLVLPRDNRVLRDAPPEAIVEALTGVRLTPQELRAMVAGCGFGAADPSAGRAFENGWVAVEHAGTSYLRQRDGRWRLAAATRGALTIEYADYGSRRPATIRLRAGGSSGARTDLTVRLSDVDINVPLGPEVFRVAAAPDAEPLTLDELRRAGPLGQRGPDQEKAEKVEKRETEKTEEEIQPRTRNGEDGERGSTADGRE